jgi:predicted Zn finger-like uncharacterized protein
MTFYAIQVTCPACRTEFLVGGAHLNDIGPWRESRVACHACGTEIVAGEGAVVRLSPEAALTRVPDAVGSSPSRSERPKVRGLRV